jgi:hypothetical protein
MVYQDLALAGNLRIDENIFLGRELTRSLGPLRLVDHAANREQATKHLHNLRIEVKSVYQRVEQLSGGQRQAVAIARATAFQAKVVIWTSRPHTGRAGGPQVLTSSGPPPMASASSSSVIDWMTSSTSATASWPSSTAATAGAPRGHRSQRGHRLDVGNKGGSDAHARGPD